MQLIHFTQGSPVLYKLAEKLLVELYIEVYWRTKSDQKCNIIGESEVLDLNAWVGLVEVPVKDMIKTLLKLWVSLRYKTFTLISKTILSKE